VRPAGRWRPYLAIFDARFRELLQYRAAAVAGLGTQLFWGLIRVMIFEAFYQSSPAPQPLSLPQVVTYVWLGQALFRMIPWSPDQEAAQKVRDGSVAYELLRPIDLYGLWFCRAAALLSAPTLLRAAPMVLLAGLFFGLQAPASPLAALGFAAAVLLSLLLGAAITALVSISLFWTVSGEGVARLLPALVWILSGIVIPLPFFPRPLQLALELLPFRGLVDLPFRIYVGQIPPPGMAAPLAQQAAWAVALVLLGRRMLRAGLRRLVVQGG
jgi:ABC-2 type transport system permease protein